MIVFGTDDYEEVQKMYEDISLGREFWFGRPFGNEWAEELYLRKMMEV